MHRVGRRAVTRLLPKNNPIGKPGARLSKEQIRQIFIKTQTDEQIAHLYNIAPGTVRKIKQRFLFPEVTQDLS